MAFPLLTIVSTQLVGAEEAGKFSIAFVTGTLIMIACNYGVRNFQVSDIDEKTSFASYQLNRWLCGAIALACALHTAAPAATTRTWRRSAWASTSIR